MITASHNPPQYNGIKIFNSDSMAYGEKSQNKIEKIIEHENFRLTDWRNLGEATYVEESHLYVEMVQKAVRLKKKWRVIVDPGCGATCNLAPLILRTLGCKVTAINAQPDGFFPGRSPEPSAESLMPLARIVRESDVDVGVAYDGDGDRVAFLDEKGDSANFDQALAAYAAYIVKKRDGGTIVTNVEASMCVEKTVEKHGGRVVRTRVGDVYVAEAIRRFGAVFGGEPCGAWIHPQIHYCPDGILSAVMLLKALEEENKGLSEFISEAPQYQTLRENVACKNEVKHKAVKNAVEGLKSIFPDYEKLSAVDGVRLTLKEGWILVRASGTEPLIRLTVEGESLKAAREIMEKAVMLVERLVEEMRK